MGEADTAVSQYHAIRPVPGHQREALFVPSPINNPGARGSVHVKAVTFGMSGHPTLLSPEPLPPMHPKSEA